ncbi:MAG TPA: ABC transporter substrate-binding protein [Acidimicrobiales bacterium]|nr:ABC transporter substrate-binding protein [Acidimicrobiales bacterium]
MVGGTRRKVGAVLLTGSLLAFGCSSDDDTAGDDTAEPTGTVEPPPVTDERPFSVMVIGDETSQISFTVAEAVPAVQGALAELPNVEVLHCDSAGDANRSQECEREAVDVGVTAVIASFGQIGMDMAILTDAGIPVIGGADPEAPNAFSLSAGLVAYAGLGVAAGEAECTKIATLYLDGADFLADMVQQGAELEGVEEVARSAIPQNTPDISPQVAALAGADADCIVLSVTPTQVVQAVTALVQGGVDAQLIASGAVFPQPIIDELGDLAEGVTISEIQINPGDDDPVVDQVESDIAAFDDEAEVTTIAMLSWASAKLIIDALPAIDGDVTPQTLTAALDGLVDAPAGGAVHPVTPKELSNPLFKRAFNPWGLLYQITDGVPKRLSDDYFSLEPILDVVTIG